MKSPTYKSPAKINLRLDIIGKRADGFHELRMIMVPITLFDEITFTLTHSKKIDIDSDKKDLINEDNLIFKAIKLFQKKYSKIRIR